MLTTAEIAAGYVRLTANKLKGPDRETLAEVFGLYLKNRLSEFPDLSERLAAAADSNDSKAASKLAAVLISLEERGFSLSELRGGRSGLQTNNVGQLIFKIKYGLRVLGYEVPEQFSGEIESNSSGDDSLSSFNFVPSVTVKTTPGW